MMHQAWLDSLRQYPIIAAIRDAADIDAALGSRVTTLFLLSGHLLNVADAVHRVTSRGCRVFVHLDLIDGLAKDAHGLQWLAKAAQPTGVITTRGSLVSAARGLNLATIQRVFLLDSQAIATSLEVAQSARPDLIEVLPGVLPDTLAQLSARTERPLIAGGLIKTVGQCRAALEAGALAVSTSSRHLWHVDPREVAPLREPRPSPPGVPNPGALKGPAR